MIKHSDPRDSQWAKEEIEAMLQRNDPPFEIRRLPPFIVSREALLRET